MKIILMMADAARFEAIRNDLEELGARCFCALPVIEGAGRDGLHSGDRVHPGNLVAMLIEESDDPARGLFDKLVKRRDAAGDTVSRLFLLPVERQA